MRDFMALNIDSMFALGTPHVFRSAFGTILLISVCTISTVPGSHALNGPGRSGWVRIAAKNPFSWVSRNHLELAACVGPCSLHLTCIPDSIANTKSITGVSVCVVRNKKQERKTRDFRSNNESTRATHGTLCLRWHVE